MYLIAGLGNPGTDYEDTRHNAGFMVLDAILENLNLKLDKKEKKYNFTKGALSGKDIIFLKPLSFMNLSGEALLAFINKYKYDIEIENILIICDDLDLPLGKIRFRKNGGPGGQNGLKNIIDKLHTKDFLRLRIGIGRPKPGSDISDYVLSDFTEDENKVFHDVLKRAVKGIECFLEHGIAQAMNEFNSN